MRTKLDKGTKKTRFFSLINYNFSKQLTRHTFFVFFRFHSIEWQVTVKLVKRNIKHNRIYRIIFNLVQTFSSKAFKLSQNDGCIHLTLYINFRSQIFIYEKKNRVYYVWYILLKRPFILYKKRVCNIRLHNKWKCIIYIIH